MISQITQKHRNTLESLADNCGIDYNAVAPYFYRQTGDIPITRGIHKNAKYRGKVYCYVKHWHDKQGRIYPTITFGTHKHGGYSEVFNGYRESQNDFDYSISPTREVLKPIPIPSTQQRDNDLWRIQALNAAHKVFNSATNANVSNHDYIARKGLNVGGCDIRLVNDCIMFAIQNVDGEVIGYQSIDKQGGKKYTGSTGGGFVVIGNPERVQFGAYYCEGLATALKIYHSQGVLKNELKNACNLPVVCCLDANNMRKVVTLHADLYGSDSIEFCADYDNYSDLTKGNTGVFTALEICKSIGVKSFYLPISENDEKVDFADTLKFKKTRVPKNYIEHLAALVKVAPKQRLTRYWQKLAYALADTAPATRSIDDCVKSVVTITKMRGLDIEQSAKNLISKSVAKRRELIRKFKTITDKSVFNEVLNVDGLTPSEVATEIEIEALFNKVMVFDNAGMGGNKTNRYIAYSKGKNGGIAVITPLITVCKDLIERFNKAGTDILDYQDLSPAFLDAHSRKVNAVFCINSITKKGSFAQNFCHLFLDEAVGLYDSIFDDTGTNAKQQVALIEVLRAAFANAESIVISDAGLADKHVKFYQSLCDNKKTILLETTAKESDKNHWLLKNHSHSHELILRDLNNGKRGVVACDTVANAIAVQKYLIKNGIGSNRILLATGENNGGDNQLSFIEKPNENAHKYDVVIHSPIIRSGTSIEFADYSFTYLLYDGVVGTSDAMQMLGRNRCATNVYLSFGNRIDKTRVTDFEMLMNGEIESYATELKNKGYDIKAVDLIAQRNDLARLRHEFTANKNADLNDYQNNFMLFAEITGRNFIRIDSDTEFDTDLKKAVKAERVDDRLNAKVLTESEYKIIKNSNIRTQAQTDAMKRYDTALMVYSEKNITSDSVITSIDVANELDGMADVLDAHLFLTTDTNELKALDKADSDNHSLKYSRVQLQKALNDVLKPLLDANEKGWITRKDFIKTCGKLEKHAPILALTGLGNYKKINRIRAGATVGNFVKKIGYEICEKTAIRGVRKYEIKPNDDIARYTANRKRL